MNRFLAIGYVLTAAIFLADLVVLPRIFPVPQENTLLLGQIIHLALIPAAIFLFIGTGRSVGRFRKLIGYSLCTVVSLGAISTCIAIALIASGHASAVAV